MDSICAAVAAGFLEGEGTFGIRMARGKSKSRQYHIAVSAPQKDLETLRALKNITGMGNINRIAKNGINSTPIFRWRVSSKREIIKLLESIMPFLLSTRNKKRVNAVLLMAYLKRDKSGGKTQPNIRKEQESIYQYYLSVKNKHYLWVGERNGRGT
jgi:hypothetical protein